MQAVEKVLAGAIRREMALEDFCAKKTSEIVQLNRLVSHCLVLFIDYCNQYFSFGVGMIFSFDHLYRCNNTSMRGNAMP